MITRGVWTLGGILFSISFFAQAQSTHSTVDCSRYRAAMETLSRSDEFMLIGIQALDPALRETQSSVVEREILRRLDDDITDTVPEACRRQVRRNATGGWRIGLSASYGGFVTGNGLASDGIQFTAYQLVGWANAYRNAFQNPGCERPENSVSDSAPWNEYYDCVHGSSSGNFREFASQIATLPPERFREILTWWYGENEQLSGLSNRSIRVMNTFYQVISNSQDLASFQRNSRAAGSLMSVEDRALYASIYGVYMDLGYDTDRADGTSGGGGVVQSTTIYDAARNNIIEEGFTSQQDHPSRYWRNAGVCRDIAAAQGQLLETLGFQNVFLVRLRTTGASGHVAVIAQDPTDPNRTFGFNYGSHISHGNTAAIGSVAVNPPTALNSGLRDTSSVYRIHRSNGSPVTTVQTELGIWLSQLGGLAPFDPLQRTLPQSSIGTMRNVRSGTEFRGGMALDTVGNTMGGVAVTQDLFRETRLPTRLGFAFSVQMNSPMHGGGVPDAVELPPISLDIFYMYVQNEFNSRTVSFHNNNLHFRIETLAQNIFSMHFVQGVELNENRSYSYDFRFNINARLDQGNPWRDRFAATYRIGTQLTYGRGDVRNRNSMAIPLLQHMLFSAQGRYRLSRTPEGRAYLIAATLILLDELGARGRGVIGISSPIVTTSAYIEGRIVGFQDGGVPLWQPGAPRRAGVTTELHGDRRPVSLFITGSASVDRETPQDFRLVGGLQMQIDFPRRRPR